MSTDYQSGQTPEPNQHPIINLLVENGFKTNGNPLVYKREVTTQFEDPCICYCSLQPLDYGYKAVFESFVGEQGKPGSNPRGFPDVSLSGTFSVGPFAGVEKQIVEMIQTTD